MYQGVGCGVSELAMQPVTTDQLTWMQASAKALLFLTSESRIRQNRGTVLIDLFGSRQRDQMPDRAAAHACLNHDLLHNHAYW